MVMKERKIKAKSDRKVADDDEVRLIPLKLSSRELDDFVAEHEQYLIIDKHDLERSCREQPNVFYSVARELALAVSRRDAAKQNIQIVEGKVDGNVRRIAQRKGEKITEREVDAKKRNDSEYVEAMTLYMRLNHAVNILSALKEAFQQRSYVLKEMVTLYVQEYYGDPINSSRGKDYRDKSADHARQEMSKKRRSK